MIYVLEVLFPYIVLLYVWDCITYVKANHVLLTSWFGKKFAIRKSGFRLAGVLPTSQVIISHNLPYHWTPYGIYVLSGRAASNTGIDRVEDFDFIAYDDLTGVDSSGKKIKLNDIHTIDAPSSASARFQVEFIKELIYLRPSERKKAIEARLDETFNLEAIKKIANQLSKALGIIKFLSSYLFLLVFIVLPTVLFSNLYKYANLNVLLIFILLVYVVLLTAAFFTVRKSYESDNDSKVFTLLSIIFSPVNALHVTGYLTKYRYFKFNSLALAAYFTPRDTFKELARRELLLIDHFENKINRQNWLLIWGLKKDFLHNLLDKCEISLEEISAPPEKQDQTATRYCPLCLTEYHEKRHDCVDCEMALKEYGIH